MALIGINPARPTERKPTTLEQVAMGFDIGTKVLGLGLQAVDVGLKYGQRERELDILSKTKEAEAEDLSQERTLRGLQIQKTQRELDQPIKSTFVEKAEAKLGTEFAEVASRAKSADTELSNIDGAFNELIRYKKGSKFGTGPIATGFGLGGFIDPELQNLQAKFKTVSLDNLKNRFAGMSKAIDSDAERLAFESTQPALRLDDDVNAKILLGMKAIALKAKEEARAQSKWVSAGKSLLNYESPVLGKTEAMIKPNGEMVIVPKKEYKEKIDDGWLSIDQWANFTIIQSMEGLTRKQKESLLLGE